MLLSLTLSNNQPLYQFLRATETPLAIVAEPSKLNELLTNHGLESLDLSDDDFQKEITFAKFLKDEYGDNFTDTLYWDYHDDLSATLEILNLKAVFRVPFIDLAADKLDPNIPIKEQTGLDLPVFSEKEALKIKQIGNFAKEHNYHILVHCEAGVSRSQAVGACLELYVNSDASNVERRIHLGNYTYFQTFFQQFNNEWKVLGNLEEPIYQEADDDENLFGFRYKMNDYEEHQLRRGAFGPEYPRSRMLGLTDRINLARLTN
jgi:dual specificity phosphatase, catalytic domain